MSICGANLNLDQDATNRLNDIMFLSRTRLQIEEERFESQVS